MLANIRKMLRTNETLQEMLAAMPVYGIVCQLTLVWFVKDKAAYALGLWIGVLMAACMAVHMCYSLERAFDYDTETAQKMITKQNLIRYACVTIACALVMVSGFINPLAAFLGLMGLKVSAYLQPFTHKFIRR
ncbi:MAG: ATP synthase subunit I [Lachnospiraceae bacterium]|nr:ATP synthase subunit I [Lachnospiraceae bacterium]